ncbi:MAG: dihydroorotate dehydrogenase electron transfer subunit, partial [Deltaproteobacteria bacterium]|nr:dihydroorotate dehydrogenase electron transfer subunit [Deltaproteobacteria bacterium]
MTSLSPQVISGPALVKGLRPCGPDIFRLEVKAPEAARLARPGQFVMIRVGPGPEPLLRRPFSVHDRQGDRLAFLFKVVGRGTTILAQTRPGESLEMLGPLGRPFPWLTGPALLVAGGMGLAPLLFLARDLAAGGQIKLRLGAATRAGLVCLDQFRATGLELSLFTEDGSLGQKGLVIDGLEEELKKRPAAILACGPQGMLKTVAQTARQL